MKQSRNGNHGACQLKRQKVGTSSAEEKGGWGDSIVFDREVDVCAAIPCCIKEPTPNQKLLRRVKLFSTTSDPGLQGWASYHSYGLNLGMRQAVGKLFFKSSPVTRSEKMFFLYPFLTPFPENGSFFLKLLLFQSLAFRLESCQVWREQYQSY